eukprot:Rhum_TRINITY_DN20743_c0_g1::Rhum_TRINITY_DN20743_c0_g1_i1::g.171873::m.171873
MTSAVMLDPSIRDWALIPIITVTLLLQLFRHYVAVVMKDNATMSKQFLKESQIVMRSGLCRANRNWITQEAFEARRKKYSGQQHGLLQATPESDEGNPLAAGADPAQMQKMMVQQVMGIGPHILMMTWVSHFFPGFIIAKLPFPLTSRFRGMFQQGLDIPALEVTYITSVCGYFLIMFGLRGIITLMLGQESEDDESMAHMTGRGMAEGKMPGGRPQVDMKKLYQAELQNWSEALTQHDFHLKTSESRLLATPAEI